MAREHGPQATAGFVCRRVRDKLSARRAMTAELCAARLADRVGLEIGGPSPVFRRRGPLPIYRHAARVDNCNYGAETVWEGRLDDATEFRPEAGAAAGTQFIREATDLAGIADDAYDFVCSSHALEHVANPLRALQEWKRVLRPGGNLVLVLPHKDATFDHRRPVTGLAHMIDDFEQGIGEDDLSHLGEILELHDLTRDPQAGDVEAFEARSRQNHVNRCLHQHVFDTGSAVRLVDHAGFEILAVEPLPPLHIIQFCANPSTDAAPDNQAFLGTAAAFRRRSPFPTDRG